MLNHCFQSSSGDLMHQMGALNVVAGGSGKRVSRQTQGFNNFPSFDQQNSGFLGGSAVGGNFGQQQFQETNQGTSPIRPGAPAGGYTNGGGGGGTYGGGGGNYGGNTNNGGSCEFPKLSLLVFYLFFFV